MRIKLDENLPVQIAISLTLLGHETHTVIEEDLGGSKDEQIWRVVQKEKRFLITQDLDFSDTRRFAPGTHHGILLIRLHSPSRLNLISRLEEIFQNEDVSGWTSCFVVATERKVRIRRPAETS